MTDHRRAKAVGATRFFTVNLAERRGNRLLIERIDFLRAAFARVKDRHQFAVEAIVALPNHLHGLWRLPPGDSNYGMRWGLTKASFSRKPEAVEYRSASRLRRGERGIWQRRFWGHTVRDEADFARHADCIHYSPVKHGSTSAPRDWPYSTFRRFVERGVYVEDWGGPCESADVSPGE